MAIPESQLETWANPGAVTTVIATHEAVRRALVAGSSTRSLPFEVYLQGSYKNGTNIRGGSDVDIVAELQTPFERDLDALSYSQQREYFARTNEVNHDYWQYRDALISALRGCFGSFFVVPQSKCIHILPGSGRIPADVLPCRAFRRYVRFTDGSPDDYYSGVKFYDSSHNGIINYPRYHYDNGVIKNQRVSTYKSTVRMFKNARDKCVSDGLLAGDVAPSYFLECLLYNAPDTCFSDDRSSTFRAVHSALSRADLSSFYCQNGIVKLVGDAPLAPSSTQWSTDRVAALLDALARLWNEWGN